MAGNIYLIQGERDLVSMSERAYDSEDLLQQLLANYPALLAGEQMTGNAPRRWLLVSREVPISAEDGVASWYVDHLYLDHEGIPTLVEVKRSSDTRIRREVVGQMLDYAANAVERWSTERLRVRFASEPEADERLREFLRDRDAEEFWETVRVNLAGGRIRMVFIADVIPPELRRIVNFLAAQMQTAEVFAVEVRNFEGAGQRALVPRLVSTPRQRPADTFERHWDEGSFLEELGSRSAERAEVARRIMDWARRSMTDFWFGRAANCGSCIPRLFLPGSRLLLFSLRTTGSIEMQFQHMKSRPFGDEERRWELIGRLNQIPGIAIAPGAVGRRPSFDMCLLSRERELEQFLDAMNWAIDQVRSAAR